MGEPQPSQPQSPKPKNPNPIPPQNNNDDSAYVSGSIVSSTTIEAPRITELSNVSSTPSKIPLRPRKIRKLSPNNDAHAVTPPPPRPKPSQPPRIHAKSLTCEGELEAAITHLCGADPLLASLIDTHPPPKYESFNTPFLALIRSILYQQLAAKAGNSIYTRFVSLCGGETASFRRTSSL